MASTLENLSAQKDILTVLIRANADAIASATDEAALSDSRRAVNDVLKEENSRLKAKVDELTKALAAQGGGTTTNPAPTPAPDEEKPAPGTPVNVATVVDIRKAIAAGAKLLQAAKTIDVREDVDLAGVTIQEAPGFKGDAFIALGGNAKISNGTLDCPNSTALWAFGNNTAIDITIKPGARQGFDVARKATLTVKGLVGSNFDQYGGYVEENGTLVMGSSATRKTDLRNAKHQGLLRGAAAKSITIDDAYLDDSGGGNAAIRGGADQWTLRNNTIVGLVGPNPLDGRDGGDMIGGDRWVIGGSLRQIGNEPGRRAAAEKAFGQLIGSGMKLVDAVRSAFTSATTAAERKAWGHDYALTDADVTATLAARAEALSHRSNILIQGGEIRGGFRLAARVTGKVVGVKMTGNPPIFTDDKTDYPLAALTAPGEAQPGPQITFENCTIPGAIPVDLNKYSGVKIVVTGK